MITTAPFMTQAGTTGMATTPIPTTTTATTQVTTPTATAKVATPFKTTQSTTPIETTQAAIPIETTQLTTPIETTQLTTTTTQVTTTAPTTTTAAALTTTAPLCDPGTFTNLTSGACLACAPGTFSPNLGSSACKNCAAGFYSGGGLSACTACFANTFTNSTGASACAAGPGGSYARGRGATQCLLNPTTSTAPTTTPAPTTIPPTTTPPAVAIGLVVCCYVIVTFPSSPATAFYGTLFQPQTPYVIYNYGPAIEVSWSTITFFYDATILTLTNATYVPTFAVLNPLSSRYAYTTRDVARHPVLTRPLQRLPRRNHRRRQELHALPPIRRLLPRRPALPAALHLGVPVGRVRRGGLYLPGGLRAHRLRSVARAHQRARRGLSGKTITGVAPGSTDVLAFWAGFQAVYRNLTEVASSVMCVAASGPDYFFTGAVTHASELSVTRPGFLAK